LAGKEETIFDDSPGLAISLGGDALFRSNFDPGSFSDFGLVTTADFGPVSSAALGLGDVTFGATAIFSVPWAAFIGGASALRSDPQPPKKEIPAKERTAATIHERFVRIESLRLLICYICCTIIGFFCFSFKPSQLYKHVFSPHRHSQRNILFFNPLFIHPLFGWHFSIHADFSLSIMEEYVYRAHNERLMETIWVSVFIVQMDTS
jgi:hypothetical protein